jgi:hypothetical protein
MVGTGKALVGGQNFTNLEKEVLMGLTEQFSIAVELIVLLENHGKLHF